MRRSWRDCSILLLGLTIGLTQGVTTTWAGPGETTVKLGLSVYNYSQATEETLMETKRRVRRIFQEIGVDIVWVEIPVPSPGRKVPAPVSRPLHRPSHPQLTILILDRPMVKRLGRSPDALAARGRSTFSELRWYPPMEAAKGSLSWVFRAKQPESVRTGP